MARRRSSVAIAVSNKRTVEAANLTYEFLKDRQRAVRDLLPGHLGLRTHRALSWLHRAEQEESDDDARFLFLWIAFNAAYAHEIHERKDFSERRLLISFLQELIESDREQLLYKAVWDHFPESIRLLIDNRHVFQPFWDHQNGRITESDWEQWFARSKKAAIRALGRMDTRKVLTVVFDRLYVLRNQIVHGGATWNSAVNRRQVGDGAKILGFVVPIVIYVMMNDPDRDWGSPCYPVIDS